jgi:hypothetical protein
MQVTHRMLDDVRAGQPALCAYTGAGGMPEVSADMMSKLATPEMMDTMQRMMKGMDPEALAGMMKQSGMDVTPEQAASMQQQARPF